MSGHPVQLHIERTTDPRRIHVVLRAVLLLAIGTVSLGAVLWMGYLAVPALVALALLQRGAGHYLADDGPRIVRVLRWLAGAFAYLWLLTDAPPTGQPGPIELRVEAEDGPPPTPASALLRLVYSLPALVLVMILSLVASVCWVIGAAWILAVRRLPTAIGDFLALTLRTEVRWLAYHLSLVDAYPTLAEDAPVHAPT
jgi:hypothetical protein